MDFTTTILDWYLQNKRDLPWRRTRDPYLIWVSEIILQQTRVEQGLPYFIKITHAYPDIRALAGAEEQELLKLWQGLGYYSRARNMLAASRVIMDRYHGVFPDDYASIKALKGIGDYTAAAIASIAFNLPCPVVDGNVLRLFSRFFRIERPVDTAPVKKEIRDLALALIDPDRPGDFNQAVMEFGATLCVPSSPGCAGCCLGAGCLAYKTGMVHLLPKKSMKPVIRDRTLHYMVMTYREGNEPGLFVKQRDGNDIWRNLFDFPQYPEDPGSDDAGPISLKKLRRWFAPHHPEFHGVTGPVKHKLTHQNLSVWFYHFHFSGKPRLPYQAVPFSDLKFLPVPRLIDRYLRDLFIFAPDFLNFEMDDGPARSNKINPPLH